MNCVDDRIEEGASGDGTSNKLGIADQKSSLPLVAISSDA